MPPFSYWRSVAWALAKHLFNVNHIKSNWCRGKLFKRQSVSAVEPLAYATPTVRPSLKTPFRPWNNACYVFYFLFSKLSFLAHANIFARSFRHCMPFAKRGWFFLSIRNSDRIKERTMAAELPCFFCTLNGISSAQKKERKGLEQRRARPLSRERSAVLLTWPSRA